MKLIIKNEKIETIPRFPNYAITKDGRVWSNQRRGIWLKPIIRNGRLFVSLSNSSYSRILAVHRLVLETFVGPCPVGMECRHLDGNPQNNSLDNLCWGTRLENQQDRIQHGTSNRGEQHGRVKLTTKKVKRIRQMLKIGIHSQAEITQYYQVSPITISRIKNRKLWKFL